MKKRLLALLTGALALCLVLVGCGKKVDPTPFIGTWELYEMEADDEVTTNEDIQSLKDLLGITVYCDLNEDGTAVLDVFGETLEGTWEATEAGVATATMEDQEIEITLADDKLTVAQQGASMTFVKIDPADKLDNAAALASLQEGADLDIEDLDDVADEVSEVEEVDETVTPLDITVADDDLCTITITGVHNDWAGDPTYDITITNNSDKTIYVTTDYDTWSVNGKMCDPVMGETIQPGKYVEGTMWFDQEDVASAADLVNVEGTFVVWDNETYEDLGSYQVTID